MHVHILAKGLVHSQTLKYLHHRLAALKTVCMAASGELQEHPQ